MSLAELFEGLDSCNADETGSSAQQLPKGCRARAAEWFLKKRHLEAAWVQEQCAAAATEVK